MVLQSLHKRRKAILSFRIARSQVHKHADAPHPFGLLRARGEWPRSNRATEKRNEFPPSDACSHSTPPHRDHVRTMWRTISRLTLEVCDLLHGRFERFGEGSWRRKAKVSLLSGELGVMTLDAHTRATATIAARASGFGHGDESHCGKSGHEKSWARHARNYIACNAQCCGNARANQSYIAQRDVCLAGAAGFETSHSGIKLARCPCGWRRAAAANAAGGAAHELADPGLSALPQAMGFDTIIRNAKFRILPPQPSSRICATRLPL
jgi:hypothetical protein